MDRVDLIVMIVFFLWIVSDLHEIKKKLDKLEK